MLYLHILNLIMATKIDFLIFYKSFILSLVLVEKYLIHSDAFFFFFFPFMRTQTRDK